MIFILATLTAGYYSYLYIEYIFHKSSHKKYMGYIHTLHNNHHKMYPTTKLLRKESYISSTAICNYISDGTLAFGPPVLVILLGIYNFVPYIYNILLITEIGILFFVSGHLHDNYHIEGSYLEKYDWFLKQREYHFKHHKYHKYNFMLGGFDPIMDKIFNTYKE